MPDITIMIVEDHEILREGLQILLEADNFHVISAIHGLDALEKMENASPDLILSDISMPEMDGYAFYDAVRSRPEWVAIPFIFLTARGERDDIFTSKKLGVEDYLVKPVDRQELVTTIRSRLERSQQLMMAQLQQAYEASLIMLANAIELRDEYTRGHVERVKRYTVLIAKQMGWTETQLAPLEFGAILHDIGKIYIHEAILSKAGPLNDSEWKEMKRHSAIGAELLSSIPYLETAIPVIRSHHERWDGQGYPDGLAGEQIPKGARIVSVADAFDAMTTARVYQDACLPEQALQEIQAGSDSRYDPEIVEAFLSVWDQINETKTQE
ncbi:MAG: response regulator [Anaerolineales bacterium]|nr:response regulator [Anaerolineales bacterium]